MEGKAELRRRMRAWRDGLAPETRAALGEAAARHLRAAAPYQAARTLLLYWATGSEVPTGAAVAAALEAGKRVCLPRVLPDGRLAVHRVCDPARELVAGFRGLLEPDPARTPAVAPGSLDLVVVPGLAFDRRGMRLGYGLGYFDRFLAGLPRRTWRVGLAYGGQVLPRLPADPWDVPLHLIVTERGILACGRPLP